MPHAECVNVSPRADDEGCCASGGQDRFSARSTHSGRFSEIDEVDGEESDVPSRRPCLVSGHTGALSSFRERGEMSPHKRASRELSQDGRRSRKLTRARIPVSRSLLTLGGDERKSGIRPSRNRTRNSSPHTNLPNHPTQFANLELELTRRGKATEQHSVAFLFVSSFAGRI